MRRKIFTVTFFLLFAIFIGGFVNATDIKDIATDSKNNEVTNTKEQKSDTNNTDAKKSESQNIENKNSKSESIETKSKSIENETVKKVVKIENGFYQIISDNKNFLDVTGEKTSPNILIGLWGSNGNANQRFKIEYQADGNYKITAVHSGLALEANGTSVIQNKTNGSNSQKWTVENINDKYYIKSVSSGLYLTENGATGIVLSKLDKNKKQTFKLNKEANLQGKKALEEGYYLIKSKLNTNMVLDINDVSKNNGANIHLWSKNQGSNQIFELKYDDSKGTYVIKSAFSGKVLNLQGAGKNNCTNVQMYDLQNSDVQNWIIEKSSDGYYTISSVCSGLYLDVTGNKTENGTNIEVYQKNNGQNQKFTFEKINLPSGGAKVSDGFYQIASTQNKDKVFDVLEAKTTDKATVGVYKNNTNANQRFKIKQKDDGYYSIINLNSNLYLEAYGTTIKQRNYDKNTIAQDWILADCGNGDYNLISRCGGLYITFNGNQDLYLSKKSGNNLQKFKLNKKANLRGTQSIPDGYYFIESSIDKGKVVDIEGASINVEANVILWKKNSANNQKFKFKYDGNGYYTITSVKSKKSLDVAWAAKNNESNVQQYTSSNNDWQKWIVEKNSDGTYSIISAHNGLYIDLPNSNTKNGTNIQLYMGNGGKNQKFRLQETTGVEGVRTISNGYYRIQTKLDTNKVVSIKDLSKSEHIRAQINTKNNGYNQIFQVICRENGFYIIKAVHSKKVLDLSSNGSNVEQDNLDYSDKQEWAIKKNSDGSYQIISAYNGLYLNVSGKGTDGDSLNVAKKDDTKNQFFIFSSTSVEASNKVISDGTYQIITNLDDKKVLDVQGASNSSGANIEIWANNMQKNQRFIVKYQANGYYKITALNSGKALGVENVGSGNSVDVKQYDVQDSIKQDWIIKPCGNGYYNIISACNGLYLNVSGSKAIDGVNVEVYTKNESTSQKFKIEKSEPIELTTGTYGSSGLKVKGDSRGSSLKYHKIGNGPNVFFATFAVHGWEDLYSYDGKALTKIAEDFKNKLIEMQDRNLANKWTIYIFPSVNPDGEYYGTTHNGPGRTTLYSSAPNHKGVDINRCWSTGWRKYTTSRNYNGTGPFQAYEAQALRDFLLSKRSTKGQTILIDLHGWLNETIGDNGLGSYYRSQYGISKHINSYGQGYLVNWARSNLGYNGVTARSALVELPEYDANSTKYINSSLNMLRAVGK